MHPLKSWPPHTEKWKEPCMSLSLSPENEFSIPSQSFSNGPLELIENKSGLHMCSDDLITENYKNKTMYYVTKCWQSYLQFYLSFFINLSS